MKKYLTIGIVIVAVVTVSVWMFVKKTKRHDLTFVFQSARGGVLETCGCHSYPYGGIDREANFLEAVRKDNPQAFYVDAGNMFVAPPKDRTGTKERAQAKASAMLEMLNEMKLDVYSPGAGDYFLGLASMKDLEKKSQFKWISSNVVDAKGNPVFAPYTKIQRNGYTVAFLAITPPGKLEEAKDLEAKPIEAALAQWLPEAKKDSDIVVLLSQLDLASNESLFRGRDLGIQVVFGADQGQAIRDAFWFAGRTIFVDPEYFGYTVGRLDIYLKRPFKGLYSSEQIKKNKASLAQLEADYSVRPDNEFLKKRIDTMKQRSSLEPIPGGSEYVYQLVRLDKETYGKPNSITQRITAYKNEVKEKALAE